MVYPQDYTNEKRKRKLNIMVNQGNLLKYGRIKRNGQLIKGNKVKSLLVSELWSNKKKWTTHLG